MKQIINYSWIIVLILTAITGIIWIIVSTPQTKQSPTISFEKQTREHLDHSSLINKKFKTGQEVTEACIKCHPTSAKEMMKNAHFQWLGDETNIIGHEKKKRIGKKNLINNFCIGIEGNQPSCTKCHAGYGWADKNFDFEEETNVDCLVCHAKSGTYLKGKSGNPKKGVDLLLAAKSVGYPKRTNCGMCHNFGGGGMGVKHGDLDVSLNFPSEIDDVHMGKHDLLCIDCHKTDNHIIPGRSMSVSVTRKGGVFCTDCHNEPPHKDDKLNNHLDTVACETCHIPTYAKRNPTKVDWDWSKAGDEKRKEDPHEYLKIKGEFKYDNDIIPTYTWYNGTAKRYLLGDKIDPSKRTDINSPVGNINDNKSKIHPFKTHTGKQPYDKKTLSLTLPTTSGAGGYWHDFDWDKAMKLGAEATGQSYSGSYGFASTIMYWPLSHMVAKKEDALNCSDCHGDKSRLNWDELGYTADPIKTGGRK